MFLICIESWMTVPLSCVVSADTHVGSSVLITTRHLTVLIYTHPLLSMQLTYILESKLQCILWMNL